MPSKQEILLQSKSAYNQWAVQWGEHAVKNANWPMKSLKDFAQSGIGKSIILIGNGHSLEEEIETLIKYQRSCDIICCDKTIGHLLSHGVIPTYCVVCDANVDYEKYLKPWAHLLSETILIMNVCGNPLWAECQWKDRYFFVNKDIIKSEKEFMKLSGCTNVIAAATNVTGAMAVLLTQSDEKGIKNFFGYDLIGLVGVDYCWRKNKYYAFDNSGAGKDNYLRQITLCDLNGEICFTSSNLMFSQRWLAQYIKSFNLPFVQCSKSSILATSKISDLKTIMNYNYKKEDMIKVKEAVFERKNLIKKIKDLELNLKEIAFNHRLKFNTI